MNVYGQLVKAQKENLAADPASTATGLVYFNTVSLFPKYYNGTSWLTYADTSSAQVITNKDIDGGTAANTRRITIPKDTKTNLDALARKQGTLVYATDQNKLYADDGSQLKQVGSGAGEKNYIGSPDDAGSWAASAAGVTVITTVTAATLPEESKESGIKLTGVSGSDYAYTRFTLDDGDKSKKLKIQMYVKSDAAYVSDDFEVQMWTNTASNYGGSYAQLTVSMDPQIFKDDNGSLMVWTFDANTSDYYELRIKRNAGTGFIVFSGVLVGPGLVSKGAVISDWAAYSPAITNLGSVTGSSFFYRRVGSNLEVRGRFIAGTVGVGVQAELPLPSGLHVDTNVATNDLEANFGEYHGKEISGSSVNIYNTNYSGVLVYDVASGTDRVVFAANTSSNTYKQDSPTTIIGNNAHIDLVVSIPILEWSGQGTMNTLQQDNLTNWAEYSPAISAGISISSSKFRWRRVGDSVEVEGEIAVGAGSVNSTDLTIGLPNGWTIDTAKYPHGGGTALGVCEIFQSGRFYCGIVSYTGTPAEGKLTLINAYNAGTTGGNEIKVVHNDFLNNGDFITFKACVQAAELVGKAQTALVGFTEVLQNQSGLVKSAGQLLGTNTNDAAASGYVGEYMEQTRASGSALSLTTATPANVTATPLTLTPGDWDIEAQVGFDGTITGTLLEAAISETSASFTGTALGKSAAQSTALPTSTADAAICLPRVRKSVSVNTTVYLVAEADFTVGSAVVYGTITARRVR